MRGTQRIAIVAVVLAAFGVPLRAQGQEGVTVHGHWTIDVKNADGTLAKRHEIENALVPNGAAYMARFLAGVNSPGLWAVTLVTSVADLCGTYSSLCFVSENRWFDPLGGALTLSTPTTGQVVLTGSFTSPGARSFIAALSYVQLCSGSTPTCDPNPNVSSPFTRADFAPISVQAGQIIQVTVAFTFS